MIVSVIRGKSRREIVQFLIPGVAFEQYETGEFFEGITRRFSKQKQDDSRRLQKSKDKKPEEEEETRKAQADKMKRKQKTGKW